MKPLKAGDGVNKNVSDSDITKYLNLVSLKPEQYIEKMKLPQYQLDYYETFNPNPLVTWPVIEISNDKSIIPIFPYLFRR